MKNKVTYINAYAVLKDKNTIELTDRDGNKTTKTSDNILIAVGGRPNYLNVPGSHEFTHTSDDIFWS